MNQLKLLQYQYDIQMWKRVLHNAIEENALLKNRLAEFSKLLKDKKEIELLEYHLNSLIKLDNVFSVLRNEIYHYSLSIENDISAAEEKTTLKIPRHKKLSKDLELIESTFNKSKYLFTGFVNDILNEPGYSN